MTFHFELRASSGPLARWVDSLWSARGRISHVREQIAPLGATVAVLNLGDPIVHATTGPRASRLRTTSGWLCGPHDRPSWNEPTGGTHCYGVVSTPVGCWPLFGLDPRTLRGRVVPLETWGAGPALRRAIAGLEPASGLDRVEERLAACLAKTPPRVERISDAVAWLQDEPGLAVSQIAQRLEISPAHLVREFTRVVGLGPRQLAGILRVRRLLTHLDVRAETDWAALSARYGWYDQSHLVRDFKRYTGATPTAYVAAQREHFDPGEFDDSRGFVPEGTRQEIKSVQDARASTRRS